LPRKLLKCGICHKDVYDAKSLFLQASAFVVAVILIVGSARETDTRARRRKVIKRGPTHVTDTLAVRTILSAMPANWLVRNLEERDYGIDMTIEMFDAEKATGKIALVQVKGQLKSFRKIVKLAFPVKTVEYALLFAEPFFLFHTSVRDKKTYFIWVQKYVSAKLSQENPKWHTRKKVTFEFPPENTLAEGKRKIEEIMARYAARTDGLEFLAAFDWLLEHWQAFRTGEQDDLIEPCIECFRRIVNCDRFFSVYTDPMVPPNLIEARNCLEALATEISRQRRNESSMGEWMESFERQIDILEGLKKWFLDESDMDKFSVEQAGICPY
jgi:hypothetical protein